ncbi:twin-arginine translocation signal domain-containing protein [Nocardia sp. SYP-A9097]|uniref:GMC oxidoreductase n=1 Tax=Nocardia sp. SYP-A9097 TaxID=2663237 RepID=UPI00129B199F|nr:GMC oxidoreductase [Nocardia sp. SYP-A9097]MRH91763.1 twin-arginine translocation signal domain-containing protein [Nocardia sp. SYP-A9097]
MDRRGFIKGAGLAATTLGIAGASTATPVAWADDYSPSLKASMYRMLVPEIFAPLPDPADHVPAIVIGSGFGASITALRLAQSGTQVAVLERGSRWPSDPWRDIFATDTIPDGRGFWHRTTFTGVNRIPLPVDPFGGVLDVSSYRGIDVWRGACVGGGSVVFTGVMIEPEQRFFDHVFRGVVGYREMHDVYYPKVRKMLRPSLMPDDIYHSSAFAHSRAWDEQVRAAGYTPQRIDGTWNWNIIRDELAWRSRPSATVGCSNLGNSNGAKFDLNQNYLRYAEATHRAQIYPGHRVDAIAKEPGASGRYTVAVTKLAPTGEVLRTRTLTCDTLFLAAGSIGTSELLVRARATDALPDLNEHIGEGWGSNGDVALARPLSTLEMGTQGTASASRILDEEGAPVSLENWFIPGTTPYDITLLGSLGIVLDDTRGRFVYNPTNGSVDLQWPHDGAAGYLARAREVNNKACNCQPISRPALDADASFTSHPLGGAVVGRATDPYGRVCGYRGLYVMDGAAVPGSTGTVNPSLTISALAERNIEQIIHSGG